MTVVSAMLFNEQEGAIVADTQLSVDDQKDVLGPKIWVIDAPGGAALVSGTGTYFLMLQTVNDLQRYYVDNKGKKNLADPATDLASLLIANKWDTIKSNVINSEKKSELMKTILGDLSDDIVGEYAKEFKDELSKKIDKAEKKFTDVDFLVLQQEADKLKLYTVENEFEEPQRAILPFETIGTGEDDVDPILKQYMERMTLKQRENIPPLEGLAVMLYAFHGSTQRNLKVGGKPMVRILKEGAVIAPDENRCKLAISYVRAEKAGFISLAPCYEGLEELLYNLDGASIREAYQNLFSETDDKIGLGLFLGGYGSIPQ